MTYEYSLAHLTVLECTPTEMAQIAVEAGYNYISIRPIGLGTTNEPTYPLAQNKKMLRETKNALQQTGIKLLDIEMVRLYDGVDVQTYEPHFEVAAELGGKHVLTTIKTKNHEAAAEDFAKVCDLAKHYNLTIDLEFLTWYELSTLQEAKNVLKLANRENAGILVDTLHFHRSNIQLQELSEIPSEWFHYAHICDATYGTPTTEESLIHTARQERLYPGEGVIPICDIVAHLPKVPLSLEIPHLERQKELGYAKYAKEVLDRTKQYFDQSTVLVNK